jgi:hypothetical protein
MPFMPFLFSGDTCQISSTSLLSGMWFHLPSFSRCWLLSSLVSVSSAISFRRVKQDRCLTMVYKGSSSSALKIGYATVASIPSILLVHIRSESPNLDSYLTDVALESFFRIKIGFSRIRNIISIKLSRPYETIAIIMH